MPAGQDEQLAIIFKEMRRAAGISKEELAIRLATTAETIAELEKGSVHALPEWSELERIVSAYTGGLGLDARPVLRRLKAQIVVDKPLVAQPPQPAKPPAPPAPPARVNTPRSGALPMPPSAAPPRQARVMPPQPPAQKPPPRVHKRTAPPQAPRAAPAPRPQPQTSPPPRQAAPVQPQELAHTSEPKKKKKPGAGRLVSTLRPILNWAILLGFVAALGAGVWYAAKRPRAVWSALDSLPAPIPRLMRSAWELVRPLEDTKPRPQISDPDHRKSDKLR